MTILESVKAVEDYWLDKTTEVPTEKQIAVLISSAKAWAAYELGKDRL